MAATNVQTFSGNVGVGTDNPAYSLDVNGTSRLPIIVSTDYSRDISQEYLANFDDLTATDEELCIFEVNPDLDSYSWINGEIEVEIMSRRAQTFMSYLNQKVKIKFNFAWDARSGSGGWRSMSCFVDHTRYIESGGGQNIQYPVTVFYKYKGTRDPTDIQPKLQVYIKYSGTNFFGYFSVKGHYNSSDFNSFNPTFPSTVFTTDGNTTDTQATVYMANDFNTGNVGIGTTNPGKELTVAGNMELGTGNADYQHLRIGGGNSSGFLYGAFAKYSDGIHVGYNFYNDNTSNQIPNASGGTSRITMQYGQIQLHTGGVNTEPNNSALVIDSAGDVGIGTANPGVKLHLGGVGTDSGPRLRFETQNNGNGDYTVSGTEIGGIQFGADDYGWTTQHMSSEIVGIHDTPNYDGARGILAFKTSSAQGDSPTEKMRINYNGNVGIGTTNPSEVLTLFRSGGTLLFQSNDNLERQSVANRDAYFSSRTHKIERIADNDLLFSGGSASLASTHQIELGYSENYTLYAPDSKYGPAQHVMRFNMTNPGASTTPVNIMTLLSSGKVGIGTTNPDTDFKLHVHGGTTKSDGFVLGTGTNTYLPGSIYTDGNWGMILRSTRESPGVADFSFTDFNGNHQMTIRNSNIGLGYTTPSSRIHMYKNNYAHPTNGTEFGTETSQSITFRSIIHSGGQAPAPTWYNSAAVDNIKMWYNPKSYQFVGNNQAGAHGVFNIGGGFLDNSQANTPTFTITTNDRVGINREQPSYTLDINGSVRYTSATLNSSDNRIKRNIVDVNDASALETIRLIKPKRYDYIDTTTQGTEDTVWGFIAQEVREVLPYATDVISDFIPNIMTWANVVGSNVITINTTELLSNTGNILLKDVFGKSHYVTIAEVIDANSLRVEEDLSMFTGSRDTSGDGVTEIQTTTVTVEEYNALEDTTGYESVIGSYTQTTTNESLTVEEYNALEDTTGYEAVISSYTKTEIITPGSEIFVYGQEVDDFHVLKKDAIWTVTTAALQEVDRQQQSDKIRITEIETQITSMLSRLDALEA
jgi:hypothetical protein